MAFTLRVTQGSDEPELLSFDGGEVRLGRTADNDVVIKDPASSRSHARVYEEDGRYFVEDLRSANGTLLNERPLTKPTPLEAGDKIAIGDVVLEFSLGAGPSSTVDTDDDEAPAPPRRPPSKPATPAVAAARPARKPAAEPGRQAFEPTAPRGRALVKPASPSRVVPATRPPDELAADKTDDSAPVPTAAEKARARRELQRSSMGRVQLLWSELPRPTRIAVGLIGTVLTVVLAGTLVNAVMPKRRVQRAEPIELTPNGEPIEESFGEGPDVSFERPDMKSFTFSFASPTAIVGVLHYQARDCSKDEVSIELNGVQVGTVPPDTMDADSRQLEIVLPSTQLKINDPNEVVFDNVTNPPANDPWRIWNISVEVIPVPEMSANEAAVRARDNFQRAARLYDLRGVGAMNLFRAWKEYRDAWLLLEATPDRPDELLQTARARMREIRPMLDAKCASIMLAYEREMSQEWPNTAAARRILQEVPSYFEKEHPCFGKSRYLLANLEDLSEVE